MATYSNFNRYLFGLALFLGLVAQCQALAQAKKPTVKQTVKKPVVAQTFRQQPAFRFTSETEMRQAVYDSAARFVGMTEKTDNNDAKWIAIINKAAGLPERSLYCASAFNYVHAINGIKLPVGEGIGMVRSYFKDPTKIIYRRGARGNQRSVQKPKRMDAVSLYASHIEGLAMDDYDPDEDDRVKLIGFNTSGGRGTKDGCYVNWRNTRDIKAIANFLTPYWAKHGPKP